MTLASVGSPIFPLVVHQPASPVHLASSAVPPAVEDMMCVVCVMLQRGHSGDGNDLALTLCKYDLRKGDLFVLSWARVLQVRQGSISSELLMCGEGVHNIVLLPLEAK